MKLNIELLHYQAMDTGENTTKPQNAAFHRSINSLAHPITIAAVILLLLNDHFIRHQYPSWLTGKLGDFTWLVFAPLICAALAAWLIPRAIQQHERIVAISSFVFIGIWFATAKTIPAIHGLTTATVEAIIGWRGTLRMDASDLVTLPALLIGLWIWHQARADRIARPAVWSVLAFGIMGTLASTEPFYPVENRGITCITVSDEGLQVHIQVGSFDSSQNNYDLHASNNGGMHWTTVEYRDRLYRLEAHGDSTSPSQEPPGPVLPCTSETKAIDPDNSAVQYRYYAGQNIEQTLDRGRTWSVIRELPELKQEIRYFIKDGNGCWPCDIQILKPGPHDVKIDPKTGNVLFAMGWDGVLIYTHDHVWQWVSVGEKYHLENIPEFKQARSILFYERWLGGALVFLILTSSFTYLMRARLSHTRIAFIIIGWIGWLALLILFTPVQVLGIMPGEDRWVGFGLLALPLLFVVAIPSIILCVRDLWRWKKMQMILPIIPLCVMSFPLYLIPYYLWSQGTVPQYQTAKAFALMIAAGFVGSTYMIVRQFRPLEKLTGPDADRPLMR